MSFRKRTIPAVALGAALALGPVLATAAPASALTTEEQQLVDQINAAREAAGLAPLTVSEALTLLAEQHSAQMASAGTIFHTSDLAAEIGSVYPNWTRIGENVGMGSSTQQLTSMFLASPEHAANIYGDYNLLGVGVYTNPGGVMFVTELFAKAVVTTSVVSTSPTPTTTSTAPATATTTSTSTSTATASTPTTTTVRHAPAKSAHTARPRAVGLLTHASATGAARAAAGDPRQGAPDWAQNNK